jgi:hypothetical protein
MELIGAMDPGLSDNLISDLSGNRVKFVPEIYPGHENKKGTTQ